MTSLALLVLVLAAPAPATQPATQPAGAEAPEGGVLHRGAAFTLKEKLTLDEIVEAPEKFSGKTVQVTGKVSAVCKKKGCWLTLRGLSPKATARVTFKDYAFFVPMDCEGQLATVEGTLEVKKLSLDERKHLAEDGNVPVDRIPEAELRLVAAGIELRPAGH